VKNAQTRHYSTGETTSYYTGETMMNDDDERMRESLVC